jgi:hypothetical protein
MAAYRKFTTFEEKINGFFRWHEYVHTWMEEEYLQKFAYLPAAEIHDLLRVCRDIEWTTFMEADRLVSGIPYSQRMKEFPRIDAGLVTFLQEKYSYLEEKRRKRFIAKALYYLVA